MYRARPEGRGPVLALIIVVPDNKTPLDHIMEIGPPQVGSGTRAGDCKL